MWRQIVVLLCLTALVFSPSITATKTITVPSQLELVMTVPDTVLNSTSVYLNLPIYIDNFFDTIAGFQFVLRSTDPAYLKFTGFDSSSTLASGFEYAEAIDLAGDSSEIWFRCLADAIWNDNRKTPGFAPQQGNVAIRIKALISQIDSGLLPKTIGIRIINPIEFASSNGNAIGAIAQIVIDTTYLKCTLWQGRNCLTWAEVNADTSSWDSLKVDTSYVSGIDTNIVNLVSGSVTIIPQICAVCDLDCNQTIDIGDLTQFIGCLFIPGFQCAPIVPCDWNGDGTEDIGDLTEMISFLFIG